MATTDNISKLYKAFSAKYDNFKTEDEFRTYVSTADAQKMQKLYDAFSAEYDNFSDVDQLKTYVGWKDPKAQAPASKPATQAAPATEEAQPQQQMGWRPSPMQYMQMQQTFQEGQNRLQAQAQQFNQRMENMRKYQHFGGLPEHNLITGEKTWYTPLGTAHNNQLEASRITTEYHRWYDNTEQGYEQAERRREREMEGRIGAIWSKNDTEGTNAAELAWADAEAEYKRKADANADKHWDAYNQLGGGPELRVVTVSMNRHDNMIDHMRTFDLDRLMDSTWDKLGKQGQKKLIDYCTDIIHYRYPTMPMADCRTYGAQLARQQSDIRLYNLAVEKNMPKNNLDYLFRKIGEMNVLNSISVGLARSQAGTTGDLPAYEQAMGAYGKDHKVLNVTGVVFGMGLDPVTWLSGGVGSLGAKGVAWAGGRFLLPSIARGTATRAFTSTLTGRIATGVGASAANLATYEALKEGESQFMHGGQVIIADDNSDFQTKLRGYKVEDYSLGSVAGQGVHGAVMGTAIGWLGPVSANVGDKIVPNIASTSGKVATRLGLATTSTLMEGTIFSIPEWIEAGSMDFDVWSDNMGMMFGFKGKQIVKSGFNVLGDIKASREGRLGFESRVRQRMDASSAPYSLTKDEKNELRQYGYDDIIDLMNPDVGEQRTTAGVNDKPGLVKYTGEKGAEQWISLLQMMIEDGRVSEAARAKMYYIATGRMLPMSTVMSGAIMESSDGFVVQSYGTNGVITSRHFSKRKDAELELGRIQRQVELNSIDVGERYVNNSVDNKQAQEAFGIAGQKFHWEDFDENYINDTGRESATLGADVVGRLYTEIRKRDPETWTHGEKELVEEVERAFDELSSNPTFTSQRPEGIRADIKERTGIDVDEAIRKEPNRRSEAEAAVIKEYAARLFPESARSAETTEETATADEQSQAIVVRDDPMGQAYKEGYAADETERVDIGTRYEIAQRKFFDKFGMSLDEFLNGFTPSERYDQMRVEGATQEELNIALEAFSAKQAHDGACNRMWEDVNGQLAVERENLDAMTNSDGVSVRKATLRLNDEPVYIIEGNVEMMSDGTMIDKTLSDDTIVVFNPATGKREMISPDALIGIDSPLDVDDMRNALREREWSIYSENYNRMLGRIVFNPGEQVTMFDDNGEPVVGTLIERKEDGNCIVQFEDGTQIAVMDYTLQDTADQLREQYYMSRHQPAQTDTQPEFVEQPAVETEEAAPRNSPPTYQPPTSSKRAKYSTSTRTATRCRAT